MKIEGTKWTDGRGKTFRVISKIEIEGNSWIYYIREASDENETREYSCYEESFLSRFIKLPDE
jgi:hypothetical protein